MPEIFMPRLSDTMEEGVISSWLKQVGEQVTKGDIIAEIETDKATMELEAYEEGVLERILVDAGATVPIGTPIAIVGSGEGVSDEPAAPAATTTPAAEPEAGRAADTPAPPQPASTPAAQAAPADQKVKASPLARAIAREHGIDLRSIRGTGPAGRVVRSDVLGYLEGGGQAEATPAAAPAPTAPTSAAPAPAAASAAPATATEDVTELPLTNIRKITARRLQESMQSAPHFYLTIAVDAEELGALRAALNEQLAGAGGPKISVNDLIVKACAVALRQNPAINVSWGGDKILQHHRVNVGVAVALESGLIVPVIHDADRKSISEVSTEAKALAEKARAGKLSPAEFSGGTFTVSNLGMFGISHFTAVINPPESAILAVGAATPQVVAVPGKRKPAVRQVMNLTLSIDHRALDGATGAQFLRQLKEILESPLRVVS